MPNTFFGLNISTLGIHAANANLNVTANNIANEYTKGYSRQVAYQQATTAIKVHQKYGMIGSGVEVTSVERIRNNYYDVKYQENQTRLGENSSKYYYMLKIEDLFNEAKVDGFTEEFDNLYNAIQELKKDPSDPTARSTYLNYAESFIEYMQEIKTDLKLEQEDLNAEINNNVNKINSLAEEIASLNKQINVIELTGAHANELRDRRSVLLDELSQITEITTYEEKYDNGKSDFTVKIGGATLVSDFDYYTLKVEARTESANPEDVVGLYNIYWSHGQEFNPSASGIEGTLKGLMDVRDGNNGTATGSKDSYPINCKGVPYYIKQVNEFLDNFTKTLNEVHAKGTNLYGDPANNIDVFVKSPQGKYTINDDIKKDPKLLATAYDYTDGVSQYDLVEELLATKKANTYNGGTANEFLQAIVTDIAVDTRKVKTFSENYENMKTAIENQRQSIMGVDKDEEAMNLIKFQEAYDLNSKVISVMAEIYDKLIQQTGV